jgi:glycogen debranching enzyme
MTRALLILFILLTPTVVSAESADFLRAKIDTVNRSLVCSGWEGEECRAVFLIKGKNFLNSNGREAVLVGDEWADILRWTDTLVVAAASEHNLDRTPAVTLDTTLHRPVIQSGDLLIDAMFEESVDVAIESIKTFTDGGRYLVAGPKYTDPERTYYRDSYWTSGLVMMIEPYVVRDQIKLLARGIEPNGAVPSAIPVDPDGVKIPLWLDHHDSGPYFIMMVHDYLRWTGDTSILDEQVNGRTIFTAMEDVATYLSTKDTNGNYLPEKPNDSFQDWLDTIPRGGEVLYNQALYYQALRALVDIAKIAQEPSHSTSFHRQSLLVRHMINKQFWNARDGYYYERCTDGVCEERITNESSLVALYGITSESRRNRLFESLRVLETRSNNQIPYGDWGVINAWPLYDGFTAHDYHNGTDWPFLDAMNASARLKYDNDDWYYPLTRWWSFNEEQGSLRSLPEYVSPIDEDGGDRQAWSVSPAASFVLYGLGIDPDIDGEYEYNNSPIGPMVLGNVVLRGERIWREF